MPEEDLRGGIKDEGSFGRLTVVVVNRVHRRRRLQWRTRLVHLAGHFRFIGHRPVAVLAFPTPAMNHLVGPHITEKLLRHIDGNLHRHSPR